MPEKNRGLFQKYNVERVDGKPMAAAFVLEYGRDPFALIALEAYANALAGHDQFTELRLDLERKIMAIKVGGLPCRLDCPRCGTKHVDEGEWAFTKHRTHQCQNPDCKHEWQPFDFATFGIEK